MLTLVVYRASPHLLPLPTYNEALLPSIKSGKILELLWFWRGYNNNYPWEKYYFLCTPKCFWHYGRAFAFLHFISTVTVTSKLEEICDGKPLLKDIFRLFGSSSH